MNKLPEEVVLNILGFLEVPDIVRLQRVSSRYLTLGRDSTLWKTACFNHSRAEAMRRRQYLLGQQDARIAELRNAVTALPGADLTAWEVSQLRGSTHPRASSDPESAAKVQRARALANWEPGYPEEQLDYYEEFIHRHAEVNVGWLDLPKSRTTDKEEFREATGTGTLNDVDGNVEHLVAPLDDGSICVWDVSRRSTTRRGGAGRLLSQTRPGFLTGLSPDATADSHIMMTETGAVECVSVDSSLQKGYFAVQDLLHEVDLHTLQLSSTKRYPWPITALSEAQSNTPITIGTNWTIHLHDPRDPAFGEHQDTPGGELIGGQGVRDVGAHGVRDLAGLRIDPAAGLQVRAVLAHAQVDRVRDLQRVQRPGIDLAEVVDDGLEAVVGLVLAAEVEPLQPLRAVLLPVPGRIWPSPRLKPKPGLWY